MNYPGEGEEPLASGSWRPVPDGGFHAGFERYVRFDKLPFYEAADLRGETDL